jgi:hypothetical protein
MKFLFLLVPLVSLLASCVQVIPADQAAYTPAASTASPVGVAVVDHRSYVLDGDKNDKYVGRARGAYGIPVSVPDPQMTFAERIAGYAEAGLQQKGAKVVKKTAPIGSSSSEVAKSFQGTGANKVLVLKMNDLWCDFPSLPWSKTAEVHYDITADVLTPDGRLAGSARRTKTFNVQIVDMNDSLYNHFLKAIQPEFKGLLANPSVRNGLR